jgi:hypothetical protein
MQLRSADAGADALERVCAYSVAQRALAANDFRAADISLS